MSLQDPREELASIAASVRALVEWHEATGSLGLPVEGDAQAALASIAEGRGGPRARPAARASQPDVPPANVRPSAPMTPGPAPHAPQAIAPPPARPAPDRAPMPAAAAPAAPPRQAEPTRQAEPARQAEPPKQVEPPEERRARLALIAEEVRSCTRCVLHAQRTQTVFARGNPGAELCFIGEGPGAEEDARGEPFVGKAGQLLDKMVQAMGYQRDDVYICNIVKCRPPLNRKPEPPEMEACSSYLEGQLGIVSPRVIVALGATAVQGLIGTFEGITRMRGKWKLYKGRVPIMPTFHPAYLLRQPTAKREVWQDLQEVMRFLGKPARG